MKPSSTLLPLLLALLSCTPALPQGTPPLRRWEATEFGGERQVWDIASAPDGTIALANAAGLLLFDGVRWRRLPVPSGQVLRTVTYHPADSSWWAGSYDGWWRWSAARPSDPPVRVSPPNNPKEEWWHTLPDPGAPETLLWQTFSRLVRQSPASGSYESLPTPGNILFARAIRDTLFLPVIAQGLYYRDGGTWRPYPGGEAFAKTEIAGIAAHPGGGLLVATRGGGLSSLRGGRVAPWPSDPAAPRPWAGQPLNGLLALRNGGFALATSANGLYLLSGDGRATSHLDAQHELGDDTVLGLHQDERGGLWVGLNDGLAYLSVGTGAAIVAAELGPVYDVLPVADGLLLSTNEGLYLREADLIGPVSNVTEQVWHVTASSAGIVAGTNEGTFLLDEGLRATRISQSNGGWTWLEIDSATALAGTYVGVERYARAPGRDWASRGRIRGLRSPVRQLYRAPGDDSGRKFYIVHPQEGLSLLTLDDSLTAVASRVVVDSLPGRLIETVGDSGRTLDYYTPTRSLSLGSEGSVGASVGPEPYSIPVVYAGRKAVASLAPRLLRIGVEADPDAQGIGTADWSLDVRLDYPLLKQLLDGTLAVGLHRGLAIIDLDGEGRPPGTAPVRVTTEQTGNSVVVRFAQARYDRAPRFRVRLAGGDTSFTAWATEGEYPFPQLKPGAYVLDWESDDGQRGRVEWEVPPPFYQHPLAYVLYGLLVGAGFYGLRVYYRRRLATQQRAADVERERQLQAARLKAHADRLEDKVRVSEREIELSHRELALRQNELEQRNRELAQSTLAQARHNESLLQIKEGIAALPKSGEVGKLRRQLNHVLEQQLSSEEDWVRFSEHFDAVHVGFLHRLHEDYPELTPGDLRLAALLRMNLPSKEIAPLLHLSVRGVENKRYRLRKKLDLVGEDNLTDWILSR